MNEQKCRDAQQNRQLARIIKLYGIEIISSSPLPLSSTVRFDMESNATQPVAKESLHANVKQVEQDLVAEAASGAVEIFEETPRLSLLERWNNRYNDTLSKNIDKSASCKDSTGSTFEHKFEPGDHVIRWSQVALYPIHIDGIILSTSKTSVTLCDFGVTSVGADEEDVDGIEAALKAAWEKVTLQSTQSTKRINLITIHDARELRRWSKIRYGCVLAYGKSDERKSWLSSVTDKWASHDQFENEESSLKPGDGAPEHLEKGKVPKLPKSDPPKLVLARAKFLMNNEADIPSHHAFFSNSECIAVWCKTGRWSTLQTAIFLHGTAIGNAKSAFLLMGSIAAVAPWLVPALAPVGIAAVGGPWLYLSKCKERWELYTQTLNDMFWAQAEPCLFVEAINQWSNLT